MDENLKRSLELYEKVLRFFNNDEIKTYMWFNETKKELDDDTAANFIRNNDLDRLEDFINEFISEYK